MAPFNKTSTSKSLIRVNYVPNKPGANLVHGSLEALGELWDINQSIVVIDEKFMIRNQDADLIVTLDKNIHT